jgi:hypothetical protein
MSMTHEQLMEAAAGEALGANTVAESDAYAREIAGDDRGCAMDRDLRETVARLAAASPHLKPSADLRGKILQATAPATFKMEDYRRATAESGRFYRWGFYAAMVFLCAGAYYNLALQSKLKQVSQVAAAQSQQVQERDKALAAFVNPNATRIHLFDEKTKQRYGEAVIDDKSKTAVVILPDKMVPKDKTVNLTPQNSSVPYSTLLVRAPGDTIQPLPGKSVEAAIQIKAMEPDAHVPQNATTY